MTFMFIEPFKLRMDGEKALKIATEMFGNPVSVSFGNNFREIHWKMYEGRSEIEFELHHFNESHMLDMKFSVDHVAFEYGDSIDKINKHYGPVKTLKKIESFTNYVKKPWEQWSEKEILESPMWICLYSEETGKTSQAMLNKMTMESYLKPQDQWIKRFFKKRPKECEV